MHQINTIEKDNQTQTYNLNYKIEFDKEGDNPEFEGNISNTNAPETADFRN